LSSLPRQLPHRDTRLQRLVREPLHKLGGDLLALGAELSDADVDEVIGGAAGRRHRQHVQLAKTAAGSMDLLQSVHEPPQREFLIAKAPRGPGERLNFRPVLLVPQVEDVIHPHFLIAVADRTAYCGIVFEGHGPLEPVPVEIQPFPVRWEAHDVKRAIEPFAYILPELLRENRERQRTMDLVPPPAELLLSWVLPLSREIRPVRALVGSHWLSHTVGAWRDCTISRRLGRHDKAD